MKENQKFKYLLKFKIFIESKILKNLLNDPKTFASINLNCHLLVRFRYHH